MAKLSVFNPEHDYALAVNIPSYTPPESVRLLGRRLQLLPLVFGNDDDLILLSSDKVARIADLSAEVTIYEVMEEIEKIEPWGWDLSLCNRLYSLGFGERLLPGIQTLNTLRRLSHRRISVSANIAFGSPLIPIEFSDIRSAMVFYSMHPDCYFKLPWSSGGRGVVACRELSPKQVEEWLIGGIRKQGSVLGEKGIDRILDFATLWTVSDEGVTFSGYSVSHSDGRGKYDGNVLASQEEIYQMIKGRTNEDLEDVLKRQMAFLKENVAPFYNGRLGIDMMADRKGKIYPCVEINLRPTMGHVALEYHRRYGCDRTLIEKYGFPLLPL